MHPLQRGGRRCGHTYYWTHVLNGRPLPKHFEVKDDNPHTIFRMSEGWVFGDVYKFQATHYSPATRKTYIAADFETAELSTVAQHILRDLQDEVAIYLRRPWPTNQAGIPLHAWANQADGEINLAFRGTGVNADAEPVILPSFPVPPKPERTVVVG